MKSPTSCILVDWKFWLIFSKLDSFICKQYHLLKLQKYTNKKLARIPVVYHKTAKSKKLKNKNKAKAQMRNIQNHNNHKGYKVADILKKTQRKCEAIAKIFAHQKRSQQQSMLCTASSQSMKWQQRKWESRHAWRWTTDRFCWRGEAKNVNEVCYIHNYKEVNQKWLTKQRLRSTKEKSQQPTDKSSTQALKIT